MLITLILVASSETPIYAQAQTPNEVRMEAVVIQRLGVNKLEVKLINAKQKDNKVIIETKTSPVTGRIDYKIGDKLIIVKSHDAAGRDFYYIADFVRRTPLYLLFGLFVALTAVVGRRRGLASLLGMALSFFILFTVVLNPVLAGQPAITMTIFAALFIIPATFYLSHGINKKTTSAVIGTILTLILAGLLSAVFVESARLTGFASEEAVFIQSQRPDVINVKGLLFAGIIIGLLGILDDITISQSSIVHQLKKTSPKLSSKELFSKAMDVGRDHIASMVNTLVLVYTGAAMPLLLLFITNSRPFSEIINFEIVAEEIVRTLIASCSLILAVPITTFIAVQMFKHDQS